MGALISILLVVGDIVLVALMVGVILLRRTGEPTSRLAWLLVVILLPVVGIAAYLLVGETRLGAKRVRRHREVVLRRSRENNPPPRPPEPLAIERPLDQIAALAESAGGMIPVAGNAMALFSDSNEVVQSLVADIDAAQKHVHLITYIYLCDRTGQAIADALIRAERRGVQCRVLVDNVGSAAFLKSGLCEAMTIAEVQVVAALPVNPLRSKFARIDLRNHRKITIVDGRIGYTGSQNVADPEFAPKRKYAPWVDACVRIEGQLVHDLQMLFTEDWYLDTDEWLGDEAAHLPPPIPGGVTAQCVGTGPNAYNAAIRQVFQASAHLAREELILTTPYFVPDEATVGALMTAARRGVTTELVVPARNDSLLVGAASRSYYDGLLDAGVRIHEFQQGLLHAKTLTMDRDLAIVSSANLDKRSLFLNFESTIIVYDGDFSGHLRLLQKSYMSRSKQVVASAWRRRPWPRRLGQNAAGLFGPLL